MTSNGARLGSAGDDPTLGLAREGRGARCDLPAAAWLAPRSVEFVNALPGARTTFAASVVIGRFQVRRNRRSSAIGINAEYAHPGVGPPPHFGFTEEPGASQREAASKRVRFRSEDDRKLWSSASAPVSREIDLPGDRQFLHPRQRLVSE